MLKEFELKLARKITKHEILTKPGGRVYHCLNLEVKGLINATVTGISVRRMKIPS
jgi:hypothetical protein